MNYELTTGSPTKGIIHFALPLIFGYILQQMYLIIDAAIVGRWIGVDALAAVGTSSSIMFLIMGFCNGTTAGFAIPVSQAFGAKDFSKMRSYVSNAIRISIVFAIAITCLRWRTLVNLIYVRLKVTGILFLRKGESLFPQRNI